VDVRKMVGEGTVKLDKGRQGEGGVQSRSLSADVLYG